MNDAEYLIDEEAVMQGLKPFQRRSVEYAFSRLFAPGSSRRFLVADEVGLGKTLVARGIIAKTINRLHQDKVPRIDVIYICSNAELAWQNLNRLNVTGRRDFTQANRLTLLPLTLGSLDRQLNFISFTPGTSFDIKSGGGLYKERALLCLILRETGLFRDAGLTKMLQGGIGCLSNFKRIVEQLKPEYASAARPLVDDFLARFTEDSELQGRIHEAISLCPRHRGVLREEPARTCTRVTGELRAMLGKVCLRALEPDLVIMDEFQRFSHLLKQDTDAGMLAHELFEYADANTKVRTLLLSATPYKMYTIHGEEQDHYRDFMSTASFLLADAQAGQRLEQLLWDYRRQLYQLGNAHDEAFHATRSELQKLLGSVMSRNERPQYGSREGMFAEVTNKGRMQLDDDDIRHFLHLEQLSQTLEAGSAMDYWQSAPYALEFMDSYVLKEKLKKAALEGNPHVASALREARPSILPIKKLIAYKPVPPGNPKQRLLHEEVVDSGAWELLWIPPSLSYYELEGPFARHRGFTKRLLFSSWNVAPKAMAALASYAVEQKLLPRIRTGLLNTQQQRSRFSSLLAFSRQGRRPAGMPVLALVYPSFSLARHGSPLGNGSGEERTLESTLQAVESRLGPLLDKAVALHATPTSREDEAWYWAAPLLLDRLEQEGAARKWLRRPNLGEKWRPEERRRGEGFQEHLEKALACVEGRELLGRPPEDLLRVTALFALAGPANVALRSLASFRESPLDLRSEPLRDAAAGIGWGFRSLFNQPEATACIQHLHPGEPYWRRVLEYAASGCLQAVLDEYTHILEEFLGVSEKEHLEAVDAVATSLRQSLMLITSRVQGDHVAVNRNRIHLGALRMRTHFALRYGDQTPDGNVLQATPTRGDQVRRTFNSPFWPFVLATTSMGQEGLDFHCYCHALVHWNLPRNPVDMEQREGRIHRYKGHAVRKNVAEKWGQIVLQDNAAGSVWKRLFALAENGASDNANGLRPCWITEGAHRIERHVYALPLSRESRLYHDLCRALTVYRMVFGQPRQDELVRHLLQNQENLASHPQTETGLGIDLSP